MQRGSDSEEMRMPTGRFEQRIAKVEVVELLHVDQWPMKKDEAITENVSTRGTRVMTDSICAPGKHVLLTVPDENVKLRGRN